MRRHFLRCRKRAQYIRLGIDPIVVLNLASTIDTGTKELILAHQKLNLNHVILNIRVPFDSLLSCQAATSDQNRTRTYQEHASTAKFASN